MIYFAFVDRATRDAYVAALNTRLDPPFPRVCPARLAHRGATLAQRTTVTAVESEDASDGSFLCGVWPGERVPTGATRVDVQRVGETTTIASKTPIAEPTTRQLGDARAAKVARTATLAAAIEEERTR